MAGQAWARLVLLARACLQWARGRRLPASRHMAGLPPASQLSRGLRAHPQISPSTQALLRKAATPITWQATLALMTQTSPWCPRPLFLQTVECPHPQAHQKTCLPVPRRAQHGSSGRARARRRASEVAATSSQSAQSPRPAPPIPTPSPRTRMRLNPRNARQPRSPAPPHTHARQSCACPTSSQSGKGGRK